MNIFNYACEFIFSSWLWGATVSWAQLSFSLMIFILLIHYFLKKGWLLSIAQAFFLQLLSFWFLTIVSLVLIVHLCGWKYLDVSKTEHLKNINIFRTCLSLAVIYAMINSIFLLCCKLMKQATVGWYILCAWISHFLGALWGYCWIILFLWHIL